MPRRASHLHAATAADAEKAAGQTEPLTLEEAARKGDRLAELKAMRLVIARALPGAPARDMAALSRRQIEIGREIEAIETAEAEAAHESAVPDDESWDATAY